MALFGTDLNAAGMNTIVGYVYDMLYGESGGYPSYASAAAIILFAIVRTINKVRDAANSRFYGFEKAEYLKMRMQGLSKKDIELLARKRDEEAKAKAEQEKAEKEKAETQDDILKDIRELLRGMTLTANGGKASEEGKPEGE